ncbi:hypothetical protein PG984_016255 [Apiospora sp. TS-2023a]
MSNSNFDLVLGASLSCAVFTVVKASHQTWVIYRRNKRFSIYVAMVWAEWVTSFVLCVVSWVFLKGVIMPTFGLFFSMICLWTIQMHCILQIILNRAALLVINKHRARQLQVGTFVIVTLINISVFCIWIPAQMHVSDRYVHLNQVWVRVEKSLFAVIDTSLNIYFLWAVRTQLIANGLTKYRALFRCNIGMAFISISLDLILIGSMSLPMLNYFQIHALAYLIKLHIELNLVDMMSRIVQTTNPLNTFDLTTAPTSE